VRAFLIDNAATFLDTYHGDGLRFDEVTVINANRSWSLCQASPTPCGTAHHQPC
jgi:1,4-alpha-glucan branching enzyme